MNCPQCGNAVPPGTPQCPNCSSPLPNPAYRAPSAYRQNYDPAPAMNGLATASFVVSLVGWVMPLIGPIVALILGIVALGQINNSAGRLKGRGFAIAGIVISAISFVVLPLMILYPVASRAREKARERFCLSRQREIAMALQMYTQDNNGVFPATFPGPVTAYLTGTLTTNVFHCPTDNAANSISFGYNSALSGNKTEVVNANNPASLLCTADGGNASHMIETPANISTTRHLNGYIASFADGHVQYLRSGEHIQLTIDAHASP